MISKPLFKQSIKANGVLWIVSTALCAIIIAILKIVMATSIAGSFHVNQEQLAPYVIALWKSGLSIGGLTSALGLSDTFLQSMQSVDLSIVMNNLYYNLAGVLVPMIFVVIVSNNLMSMQVDRGSMAFILSTPIKRSTLVFTQTVFLISALFLMFVVSAATDLIVTASTGLTVQVGATLLLNLGLFLLLLAIGGTCFLFSSIFNLSKQSFAWGGGLCVLFYINKVLGMFGDPNFVNVGMGFSSMHFFDYLTIITLLDTSAICKGELALWKFAVLLVVGIVTFTIGNLQFIKKDLPL